MDKKPEDFSLEHAGFWIRLGAGVVDGLVFLLITYVVYSLIFGLVNWLTYSNVFLISSVITGAVAVAISIVYFAGFWVWRGQTPGKVVMGIKVIRTDSSPVTWSRALLRYAAYVVSACTLFIGFIMIAFDEKKQGLHDKIADTYVVKVSVRQMIFKQSYAGGEVG